MALGLLGILVLSLMFYDEEKLRYDQFTTYILVRSVGHFVFWRPS